MELAKRIINLKTEEISAVYYFTAITTWKPEKAKEHLLMMEQVTYNEIALSTPVGWLPKPNPVNNEQ